MALLAGRTLSGLLLVSATLLALLALLRVANPVASSVAVLASTQEVSSTRHGSTGAFNFQERAVVIAGEELRYRVPAALSNLSPGVDVFPIGVLSGYRWRRDQVRSNWGKIKGTAVYFLVAKKAGEWPLAEFDEFQDLILLDAPEIYEGMDSVLPTKVQVWFHAVHEFLPRASHVMKTDDDSWVDVKALRHELDRLTPDYWGRLFAHTPVLRDFRGKKSQWAIKKSEFEPDFYPPYCSGAGYVLSQSAISCVTGQLGAVKFMPFEDVATGIMLDKCGIQGTNSEQVWIGKNKLKPAKALRKSSRWIVVHRVDNMSKFEATLRAMQGERASG